MADPTSPSVSGAAPSKPAAVDAQAPAVPQPLMEVGVNYSPGNWDGYWLGPEPFSKNLNIAAGPLWRHTLPANLQRMRDSYGIRIVRMFILGNGYNLGYPAFSDALGESWRPGPISPFYHEHFHELMEVYRTLNMKIIPSLLDFQFFQERFAPHRIIVEDYNYQDIFIQECLIKFLEWSKGYENIIYAWEVMNEPIHNISFVPWPGGPDHWDLTEGPFFAFLKKCVKAIDDHGFPSTIGHRFYDDLKAMPTGTLPQFHYYAHFLSADLPVNPNAFLGEFGTDTPGQNPGSYSDVPWPECKVSGVQRDATTGSIVRERLNVLQRLQYKLALLWPDLLTDPTDRTLPYTETKLKQITEFRTGKRSP